MKWQVVWMRGLEVVGCGEITTLASPQLRINLSPFTKDFRVWGATIETKSIYLRATFKVVSLIIKLQLYTNPYILRIISKMFPSKVVS